MPHPRNKEEERKRRQTFTKFYSRKASIVLGAGVQNES